MALIVDNLLKIYHSRNRGDSVETAFGTLCFVKDGGSKFSSVLITYYHEAEPFCLVCIVPVDLDEQEIRLPLDLVVVAVLVEDRVYERELFVILLLKSHNGLRRQSLVKLLVNSTWY